MAQQINLCSPILLTQKRYFSAATMAMALAIFVVLGGALMATWVWNLRQAADSFNATVKNQANEVETLQAAIARNRAAATPVDPGLLQQLQDRKATLKRREELLDALQEGLLTPGAGHSDRLSLLANTIPAQVWVTGVSATSRRFEITGYTLEPAALNDWVIKLSASPLLQGLKLSDVNVENATKGPVKEGLAGTAAAQAPASRAAMVAPVAAGRPVWSFHLVNTQPQPVSALASATGAKP